MSIAQLIFRLARATSARLDLYAVERNLRAVGVRTASRIPTSTSPAELRALYYLARNSPPGTVILEIGSYLGASTCYLVAGAAKVNGRVVCVDTWQNETMPEGHRDTYAEFMKNTAAASYWLTTVRKRSVDLTEHDIPAPPNLVFIDGDHSYQAVKADFERIIPWLPNEVIVAFHDSVWHAGVTRTIGEALVSGEWVVAGAIDNLCWLKRAPSSCS